MAATLALLHRARDGGYGIGAFNVIGVEHAEAIVRAAEEERAPVILQLSHNAVRYHNDALVPIGSACAALAHAASVPVALHLDHAETQVLCEQALSVGFSSVMFDASSLAFAENVATTAAVARVVHDRGAAVEAELGVVGGKGVARSTAAGNTDPDEATDYVARTGADILAVAVGSTHGMTTQTARIDLELIARLRVAVRVPLVLHGASGVPDADIAAAVRGGIVKVNYATQLNKAFTGAIRTALTADNAITDPRVYLRMARTATVLAVRDRIRLLGGTDRA